EFILVDHAIFRAFNKGALGMMEVSGEQDLAIFSGQKSDAPYDATAGAVADEDE
nr:nitrite reductase, copper-containing [Gemmatimonadota bacterium]NIQ59400.1 nitrite reductase, copper-containing [Gemmatimonadota bacterium]NIU79588.1 nitrite reductase, copper-containing [Gammaproteobacteria bacterium]NIX48176.1 nitrite reductase, copper-containing [Gemmatimonadota bacterium]NIY12583.1 nitrite reductase, copper-containing [Gemmatimonadota bacterium]